MDNKSNYSVGASTTTTSNSRDVLASGLPTSTPAPADASRVAFSEQSVTAELVAPAAATAHGESDTGTSSTLICHNADEMPARPTAATTEGEELQKPAPSTVAAAESISPAPPTPALEEAAEGTQQQEQRYNTVLISSVDPLAATHALIAASDVAALQTDAADSRFSRESAGTEARGVSSGATSSGRHLIGLADTDALPTADAVSLTGFAPDCEGRGTSFTDAPAAFAPAAAAAAAASAPVRIAILPPKAGQDEEELSPLSLASPVAAAAAQSSVAVSSPPALTCSPATAARPPKSVAVTSSSEEYTAAPSLHVRGRCYSLFPPRSSITSVSAQLSPAQTTTSRSPVSNRSPGMQTPQQQEEEYKQQQKALLWQQLQEQQQQLHEQDQLLPERALQQQDSAAPLHPDVGVSGSPAERVAACAEDGDSRREEQLQQQLQQLHHSLLAQLAASSTTAAAVSTAASIHAETTTPPAGLASAAGADDEAIPAAPMGLPAAFASLRASGTPAADGFPMVATSSKKENREHLKAQQEKGITATTTTSTHQQEQQQSQPNSSDGAVFASPTTGVTSDATSMLTTTSNISPGTSEGALPSVEQRVQSQQQLEEQQAQQQRRPGQQQDAEIQQNQNAHFSTLFQTLSAGSVHGDGETCSVGAAEGNRNCNIIRGDEASFCSSGNINCRLSVALPSPGGFPGTEATAGTHTPAGRETATTGCAALAHFETLPRERHQGRSFDGQRDARKRHSVAGTLMRRTAAAARAAAALQLGDGRKDPSVNSDASRCTGTGANMKRACDYPGICSNDSKYTGYPPLFQSSSSSSVPTGSYTGIEKIKSSRSYGDLSSLSNSNPRGCLNLSSSGSDSKGLEEQEEEDRRWSTGGWTTALVAQTNNHQERRDPAAAISDKERAALRAALLVRQDCLQRFLQATQQALSALEDNAEGVVADPGELLTVLGSSSSSPSLQRSSPEDNIFTLSGPAGAYPPPVFVEASGSSPSHGLAGACVPHKGEQVMQDENLVNVLLKQSQLQSEETRPRSLHFSDATLARIGGGIPPSPPPNRGSASSSSYPLGMEGITTTLPLTEAAGENSPCSKRTGRGVCNSSQRERDEEPHLLVMPSVSGNSGRTMIARGNRLRRPPSEEDKAAAAAAAAAAAKAVMAAAAASLLEQQRQEDQQQRIQQHVQQQQRQHGLEEQRLHQSREQQQCAVALGTFIMQSEGGNTEKEEQVQCLSDVARVSHVGAHETAKDVSVDPSTPALPSDIHAAAAADDFRDAAAAAGASSASFSGRGGFRSKTAPAFSLDDKTGFLSFLSGGEQESNFSAAAVVQAALLLHKQGESTIRTAQAPYIQHHPAFNRADMTEALAAVVPTGEPLAPAAAAATERRERPRVRFRDHRSPRQQEEVKEEEEEHGFPEHHEEFSQEQQISQQQQRPTLRQQQQERVSLQQQQQSSTCSQSSNQARTLLQEGRAHVQPCNENRPTSIVTASSHSPPPSALNISQETFLNAVAAAAAAAADKYKHSVPPTADNKYAARPAAATCGGTRYENNEVQQDLREATDVSPVAAALLSRPLSAGTHNTWNQVSSTGRAQSVVATFSGISPWSAVSVPLESQEQQHQQQKREVMGGLTGSSAVVRRSLLHPLRVDGIAAAVERQQQQQQQQQSVRNSAAHFMRPQRRTATLPCTAANVLFQSMDVQALLHLQCRCKPCAFYYNRKGCRNGMNCEFCHHEDHSRLTVKQWKKQQHKLGRQARCLSVEEEASIGGITGTGVNTRSGGASTLFNAARSQLVGTLPTQNIRETAISTFPVTWEHEKNSNSSIISSSRGTVPPLRSGEFNSCTDWGSPLANAEPDMSINNRCTDQKATGCYVQPTTSSNDFSRQNRTQHEGSFQADAQ